MMKKGSFKKLFSLLIMFTMILSITLFGQVSLTLANAAENDISTYFVTEETVFESEEIFDSKTETSDPFTDQNNETDELCDDEEVISESDDEVFDGKTVDSDAVETSDLFVEHDDEINKTCDDEETIFNFEETKNYDLSAEYNNRVSEQCDKEEDYEPEKTESKEVFYSETETLDLSVEQDYKVDEHFDKEEVSKSKEICEEVANNETTVLDLSVHKADELCDQETIPEVVYKKTIPETVYNEEIESLGLSSAQHYNSGGPYNKGEYIYSTLTITGSAIGEEIVLSVKEIEELSETTDIGYEGYYSTLTSGEIWNCRKMSGVDLYKLLVHIGMSEDLPDTTPVKITAKDGHSPGTLRLKDIKDITQYGYYESKDAQEPVETGLPVLVAYASDGQPLVGPTGDESFYKRFTEEEGYVEGADNSGGPLKLVFGQKNSSDYNAPKSSKFLDKIVVGEDVPYTRHTNDLKDNLLTVKVFNDQFDSDPKTVTFTVSEIEDMVCKNKTAKVRNYYPTNGDFYEGIDIWYLLHEKVGLTGTEGIVSFYKNNSKVADVDMDYIRNPGRDYSTYYTTKDGIKLHWIKPAIAYARDGKPMSEDDGGALAAVLPQNDSYLPEGLMLSGCDEIHVYTTDGFCSHNTEPYNNWKEETLNITGNGVRKNTTFTVEELEQQLDLIRKGTYYLKEDENKGETAEFIGLDLYALLNSSSVGLNVSADKVIVKSADDTSVEFSLDEVKKADYLNSKDNINGLKILLAYGKNGLPLVPDSTDDGYNTDTKNSGGPIYLLVGQKDAEDKNLVRCIANVAEIEVTTTDESWKHDKPPYENYLDSTPLKITGNEVKEPCIFTLRQIESMTDGIVRDSFASSGGSGNYEGLVLRYLLEQVGLKEGIDRPSKITVHAGSDFSVELSVQDVYNGIDSNYQPGEKRDVILAYAKDGYPLVPEKEDLGFVENAENNYGPIRLIVENTINQWVKYVDEVIVGDGEYEGSCGYKFNITKAIPEILNGIKVTANIEQLGQEHESAAVIFQLMKESTPLNIVALEKETFKPTENIISHFPVESGNYDVNVFVFDKFTSDTESIEESLAEPKKIKDIFLK